MTRAAMIWEVREMKTDTSAITGWHKVVDIFFLIMIPLPFLVPILLKILTTPASDGITITGARIFLSIPAPIQDLVITESQINSWCVIVSVFFLCLYLTHGITVNGGTRRQICAEFIVEKVSSLVVGNMGERFRGFAPFIAAVLSLSAFSSLTSLLGMFAPTSDINVIAGWAILIFVLITYYKLKGGVLNYVRGFTEPIVIFTPFNIISEVATPVSMTFRHYGSVLSGSVISALIAYALGALSTMLLGWLPGFLGDIPFLQVGIPAVFSIYFDVFSSCLQAFIFSMLTMLYISNGFPEEEYNARREKKARRKAERMKKKAGLAEKH